MKERFLELGYNECLVCLSNGYWSMQEFIEQTKNDLYTGYLIELSEHEILIFHSLVQLQGH